MSETMYERIRRIRLEQGLTQEELALKCGYNTRSTIARIESGDRNLVASKISTIAKALNVTPSYLMDGKTETDKEKSSSELSEEEKGLLELFRELPDDKQDMALEMLRAALHKK